MYALLITLLAFSSTFIVDAQIRSSVSAVDSGKKVICVYNSTSFTREGQYYTNT